MIQFNLLPDVKKEYIKAKRTKHLIITSAVISSGIAIAVVLVFVSIVQFGQKKHIDDLTKDIQSEAAAISSIDDIDTMLTVQNQLSVLPELHGQKTEMSRLFPYLSQLVPAQAPISSLTLDVPTSAITMSGTADSLATINKLIDTLKFAEYKVDGVEGSTKPFVIVSSRLNGDNASASYQITMTFDPAIFDNTKKVTLVINQTDTQTDAAEQTERTQ